MLHDLAIHVLENALHVCCEHRSVSISCNVCLPMTRAVKEFLSSRLIMNSRQLWNSHQRHKFLRAEVPRNILKFSLRNGISMPPCFMRIQARLGTMSSRCPKHSTRQII